MNKLTVPLWLMVARKRILSLNLNTRLSAIEIIGKYGSPKDIDLLIPLLNDEEHLVRNFTISALKELYRNEGIESYLDKLMSKLNSADLVRKLAIIEVMQTFDLSIREDYLSRYLDDPNSDLLSAVIGSLKHTRNIVLLDKILDKANTRDLLLRRAVYTSWFTGIRALDKTKRIEYTTSLIHSLIRATYEMRDDGLILRDVLSEADKKLLPEAKAYPEFIIRYLVELVNQWDYDVYVYRTLHNIIVPAYFTFDIKESDKQPFIII
jgi:HEAT repeat protein